LLLDNAAEKYINLTTTQNLVKSMFLSTLSRIFHADGKSRSTWQVLSFSTFALWSSSTKV